MACMANQISADFFNKSLKEEGVTNVDVEQYYDPTRGEVLRVRKNANGEKIGMEHTITDYELTQIDDVKKHMAMLAGKTVRAFKDHITERHEWGENAIRLDLNEAYNATCLRCGAEASMEDLQSKPVSLSETAVPQPSTDGYESLPTYKLRLTLLALLKRECDPFCPNSPHDRKT